MVSPMKLQKLVYFAHGWHLAIHNRPLVNEQVEAWKFGPVFSDLYHQIKSFGNEKIDRYIVKNFATAPTLQAESSNCLLYTSDAADE